MHFLQDLQSQEINEGFISPSDGKILECGSAFLADNALFAFSIKGHTYSIEELLKDSFKKKNWKMGLIMLISIFLQEIITAIIVLAICKF